MTTNRFLNRLESAAEDLLDELALADGLDLDSEIVTRAVDEYYRLIDYTPDPDYLAALTAARAVWAGSQDATPLVAGDVLVLHVASDASGIGAAPAGWTEVTS